MTRLRYDNGYGRESLGLFCRMPSLTSTYSKAMRFGYTDNPLICRFYSESSWNGTGNILTTNSSGHVLSSTCGYSTGSDFYLTFVYTAYDDTNTTDYEEWIEEKKVNEVEKVK